MRFQVLMPDVLLWLGVRLLSLFCRSIVVVMGREWLRTNLTSFDSPLLTGLDSSHLQQIKKIDNLISMSDLKYQPMCVLIRSKESLFLERRSLRTALTTHLTNLMTTASTRGSKSFVVTSFVSSPQRNLLLLQR